MLTAVGVTPAPRPASPNQTRSPQLWNQEGVYEPPPLRWPNHSRKCTTVPQRRFAPPRHPSPGLRAAPHPVIHHFQRCAAAKPASLAVLGPSTPIPPIRCQTAAEKPTAPQPQPPGPPTQRGEAVTSTPDPTAPSWAPSRPHTDPHRPTGPLSAARARPAPLRPSDPSALPRTRTSLSPTRPGLAPGQCPPPPTAPPAPSSRSSPPPALGSAPLEAAPPAPGPAAVPPYPRDRRCCRCCPPTRAPPPPSCRLLRPPPPRARPRPLGTAHGGRGGAPARPRPLGMRGWWEQHRAHARDACHVMSPGRRESLRAHARWPRARELRVT